MKMKDLEKNTRRFYICQFVPFTSIFDFPVATWTLRVIFNIGETMNHFEDKKGKTCAFGKKSRQSKIWGALFSEISREVLQTFLLHITGQQLIRTEFVPTHVPELTHLQFINIFWN